MAQVIQHLLSKHNTLSSNPSTIKKKSMIRIKVESLKDPRRKVSVNSVLQEGTCRVAEYNINEV
jgi:hypothetical protein